MIPKYLEFVIIGVLLTFAVVSFFKLNPIANYLAVAILITIIIIDFIIKFKKNYKTFGKTFKEARKNDMGNTIR